MGLRTEALNKIEQQLPFQSNERQQQMDAARQIQLQQALGGGARSAQPQAMTPQSGAQVAAQMQQAMGQGAITEAQKQAQARAQVEQQRQQEAAMQMQQKIFDKGRQVQQEQERLQQQLAALDISLKQRIFDQNMQFQKDELGRTMFNEQQLADWAITKAQNREELLKYELEAQQTSARRIQLLTTAHAALKQELAQAFSAGEQELDQAHKQELTELVRRVEEKIKAEQAAAANRASIWTAAGTVVGAVAGGIIGAVAGMGVGSVPAAAAGATAGAAVGKGLGQLGATATAK